MTVSNGLLEASRQRAKRNHLFLLIPASLLFSLLAGRFWFVTDDAFISFRYAENWADGQGLRYNPGVEPPVEGFSNFLWTAMMAGVRLAGGDMVRLAPWISFLLGLVLIALVLRHLAAAGNGDTVSGKGNAAAILFLALFPPFAVWSTGGLETMLFSLLLFISYERLLGCSGDTHGIQAGAAAALLALARPEGIIWALALAGLYAYEKARRREKIFDRALAAYILIVLSISALFLFARILYFEKPLPNTAYAKVGLSWLIVKRGLFYYLSFCLTFITPALLLLFLPFVLFKGARPGVRHAAFMTGGFTAFAIFSGGDFMAMARFMAPAAPYFAVLFGAAFESLKRRAGVPLGALWALAAVCLAVQALPALDLELMPSGLRRALHFRWNDSVIRSEFEQWDYMRENGNKWKAAGKALRRYASPGDSILCSNIGAVGYYSGLFVYDECGLIDPDVAQRASPQNPARLSAGHDRMLAPGYFLKFEPTYFLALVVKNHETQLLIDGFGEKGLPPGYSLKSLPLEEIEGAPERSTLVLIEKDRGQQDFSKPR